jgi:endogenous inhibitor of DNA gyrase (YacG/DUF329 family)
MADKKSDRSQRGAQPKTCRVCGAPLPEAGNQHGAFCSARCKMQDLSKWFGESYRIASTPANGPSGDDDLADNEN